MITPISTALHALGSSASVGSVGSLGSLGSNATATPTGSASFGSALQGAIGSLEQTQNSASAAAQGLATGTITDPTQAVTSVENASLAMDIASQIRDKLVDAENTIFQTQV